MIAIWLALMHLSISVDWTPLEQVIEGYRNNGAYPGAVIRVANKTALLYSNEFGFLSHDSGPGSIPMSN